MLIKTHVIFSTGLLLFIGSLITHDPSPVFVYALAVSAVANVLVDKLGHEMINVNGKLIPRRTPLTHTWFRSILWGLLVSVLLSPLLLPFVSGTYYSTYYHYYGNFQVLKAVSTVLVYGVTAGPSHMLLDVFTEKGIYVKKDGKWVRFALAHFKYNDPFANGLAVFVGFLLGVTAFGAW
jgi:hypothetical protein